MTGLEATAGLSWQRAAKHIGSVVCVAVADMDAQLWTNSQQLMTRLGSAVPVVYVESLGLRAPRLSRRDVARLGRRLRRGIAPRPQRHDGLVVVSPLVIPWHGRRALQRLNRHLLRRQLRAPVVDLPRPRLLWSYTPIAAAELDLAGFDLVVYHCVDDFGTVPRMPAAAVYEAERELAARANLVFASAPALATRLREINPRTLLVPNVADTAHFATALEDGAVPDEVARLPRPRVLYVGALSDHKVDWSLLADVSASLPEFSFVFVGPVGGESRMTGYRQLASRKNCSFLGARPFAELPAFMRGADVGIVPYQLSAHTDSVYPLKLVEYLAAGLPVVSTPLPALHSRPELPVVTASGSRAFVDAIVHAATKDTVAGREARSTSVMRYSWDGLLNEMLGHVTPELPRDV
jgi:glycosyltransferase involved in cell wall biosynthesis